MHARAPGPRRAGAATTGRWAQLASAMPASLRGAALMPAAALTVHQLRYRLAFGDDAPQALAAQGHAYLSSLAPWIVLLAALSLGASLGSLAHRWAAASGSAPRRHVGLRVWIAAALVLVAIYSGQELLEGALVGGHAAGLTGVFGGGGWWALPAALLVGGALALALRGARAIEGALVAGRPALRVRVRAAAASLARSPAALLLAPLVPLARAAAGRAPPRAVVSHLA